TCVIGAYYTWPSLFMRYLLEPFITVRPGAVLNKLDFALFNATNLAGREHNARDTYRRHYANVRRLVPKERLLEYKLGSGWEPLCEFFGKEVPGPEVEFPCMNRRVRSLRNCLRSSACAGCDCLGVGKVVDMIKLLFSKRVKEVGSFQEIKPARGI
ncbi:hypothetical protein ACJ73_08028, partial [Blastomyces percursus]